MNKAENFSDSISFSIPSLEEWREKAEASLRQGTLGDLEKPRWDGLKLPLTVDSKHKCINIPRRHESLRSDMGHPWEICQSFSDKDSLAKGLEHGVECVRITVELTILTSIIT